MLLHIPNVLSAEEVAGFRRALEAADWADGRETVGHQGAQVKRNLQLPDASPLKAELAKRGMTLVEAPAARTVDVAPAAKSLIGKVDVIYAPTDNNVMSAFEGIVKVAQQAKLPVVAAGCC